MEQKTTARGFAYYEFTDDYGAKCNIQRSSAGTRIWLGCAKIGLKVGYPWRDVSDEEIKEKFNCQEFVADNRMHLNVEQVKMLIPILQKFVETGEI